MAFVPLVPQTVNISMQKTLAQQFQSSPILNAAGTAINLSAWVDLTANASPPTPSPTGADVSFGTVAGLSTGILTLTTSASDLASVEPGTAKLIISGKPTSSDAVQVLATGVLTLYNS